MENTIMYASPSHLAEAVRIDVVRSLNQLLADGLALHSHIKVAHWNLRGPQFPSLHPLFETFAISLANHNDAVAERAVNPGRVGTWHRPTYCKGIAAARVSTGRHPRTWSMWRC